MFFVLVSSGQERIVFFHSDIEILDNGGLSITETIKVNAEGNLIKRGIYRVLPTSYEAKFGLNFDVSYDFVEVLKDGNQEDHHVEELSKEIKLYIGSSSVYLTPGYYTYTIHYTTDNQLSFYEDFDELYWNVNGNYWEFGIDSLSAHVRVPQGAHVVQYHGYTGFYGESASNYDATIEDSTQVNFITTKRLMAKEGMTIAVAVNKGIVAEPNYWEKLLKDNIGFLIGVFGLVVLALYFLFVWSSAGVDPPKGVVFPRFDPPKNLSPAATRYVYKMGYDKKAFTASLLSLAVNGYLKIERSKSNAYSLKLTDKERIGISSGEKNLLGNLFKGSANSLSLKQTNHQTIQGAISGLRASLKDEISQDHFKRNKGYLALGVFIAIPFLLVMFVLSKNAVDMFSTVWMTAWSLACLFLLKTSFSNFKEKRFAAGAGMLLFSIPFVVAWIIGFFTFSIMGSYTGIVILVLYVLLIVLFNYLLKAPTVMGRKVMDEIEGFQMYLKTAEEHRMEQAKTTEENIRLFERFLPYAVALNCVTEWTKKFESIVDEAIKQGTYQPTWHGGSSGRFNTRSLGTSLASSLHSTITTSSRAPQSSSSGGGGGFSGGGGGGGGGGGW